MYQFFSYLFGNVLKLKCNICILVILYIYALETSKIENKINSSHINGIEL